MFPPASTLPRQPEGQGVGMAVETGIRASKSDDAARLSRWLDGLFRPVSAQPRGIGRVALAAAAVLGAAGLSLTRIPHGLDIVYAEDGAVFLQDALTKSPLRAIATPYSGYLHLAPRL